MTKGKRSTGYNLRKRIQAFTSSGKKKRKQRIQSTHCTCPPKYFDSNTGLCHCSCHRKDKTEPDHDPRGSPLNSLSSPSTLQQDYLINLHQATAAQAGQPSPSTSFQTAAQAGQPSPSTSFHTAAQAGQPSPPTSFHTAAQAGQPSPPTSFHPSSPLVQSSQRVYHESCDSSDSEPEYNEEETTPLLHSVCKPTTTPENIEKDKEPKTTAFFSDRSSSEEDLTTGNMDSHSLADFQQSILELQRQMRCCTDAAQEIDRNTSPNLSDTIKPSLFHGYETENFERWFAKFKLHLERRRIRLTSETALAELALHLAGPAESFFRSLSASDKDDFDSLSDTLRERFSSKDRVWRMRQVLSSRKQRPNEPLDKYIEDLQNGFDCLELSEEEKVWFFTQGLRPDTQREVLMRQPRTFREAENAARLTQTVQQSLQDAKGNEALSRMQQQLDTLVSSLTTKEKPKEAAISAYQTSPQASMEEKVDHLEKQVMSLINSTYSYKTAIAAYQPTARDTYNRDSIKDDEINRLRDENRQLKAAQRDQPQRGRSNDSYDRNRSSPDINSDLSRALEEIRRMQSRMDGFMRTYASKNARQDQQPARNRCSRPTCEICGKPGHATQHCFHRFQHSPSSWQQQTIWDKNETLQHEPRIAAIQQGITSSNQSSHDQQEQREPMEPVDYVRLSQPISPTPASAHVPTINTIDAVTISSPTKTIESGTPNSKVKTDLDSFTKTDSEDTSTRQTPNKKQEIVVRIEICSENRPKETTNATVMSSVTEGTLANETSTSLEHNNLALEENPAAKEKTGFSTSQVKCFLKPAPTLHPLQKLAYADKNISSPRNMSLPSNQEQRSALVTTEILGHPVDLLVDSGASISVIDAAFVHKVFSEETSAIMAPSTYPRVGTVSGEKLPTIGEIEVTLSFSGNKFPWQFHVVENMTTSVVLGRDFLSANGAIINFANGTLNLTNCHSVELPLTTINSTPMANLLKVEDQHSQVALALKNGGSAPVSTTSVCFSNRFIQQCRQTASVFLKFLIILLLMSPHGHAAAGLHSQPRIATEIYQTPERADTPYVRNDFLLFNVQSGQVLSTKFLFQLKPVRLKDHNVSSSDNHQVSSNDFSSPYQAQHSQGIQSFQEEEMDR